jgi:ribose transport system substrate-binding protein
MNPKETRREVKMKRTATVLVALAAALSLIAATGAGAGREGTPNGTARTAAGPTIGLAVSTLNNPFFVTLRNGAQAAAKAAGAKLKVSDGRDDAQTQADQMQNFITQRVKVIIVNPVDSDAVVPSVQAANRAKIAVITVDRAASGGKVASHIASDNVLGGKLAATYLFTKMAKAGQVAELVGISGTSAARDRGKGFQLTLKKFPKVKLAAKQTANFNRDQGFTVTQNILQSQRTLKGLFAQNDEMALGAVRAVKQARRKVLIMGFDAVADALKAIKAGQMIGTIAQQPSLMGRLSVQTAVKVASGTNVPAKQPVKVKLVTRANVSKFK